MKKFNTRSILMFFLVSTSLASYIFLSTTPIKQSAELPAIEINGENEEMQENEIILPDIQLVKKILQIGKILVSPTQQ